MLSRFPLVCLISLILTAITPMPARAVSPSKPSTTQDQSKGFDGLIGHWLVHNRKLAKKFAGSSSWIPFDARDEFQPMPGGLGVQEHYATGYWKKYEALGLNFYDRQTQRWTLYWIDNYNLPITLQPPLSGAFVGNVGTFQGPDTFNGKPIIVRHIWKMLGKNHLTWEQAFSADNGALWETNWTMDFVRQ